MNGIAVAEIRIDEQTIQLSPQGTPKQIENFSLLDHLVQLSTRPCINRPQWARCMQTAELRQKRWRNHAPILPFSLENPKVWQIRRQAIQQGPAEFETHQLC